jgi:NADH:ubiquinone oxidoreductase subunit D
MDIGYDTILWGFEEREKLMEFYERVSGATNARSIFSTRRCPYRFT